MIYAQISHSIEAIEIDFEMDFSTIRMGTGKTMETFLVLHQRKRETFHKIVHTTSQEVISLANPQSADLTIDLRLVLYPTNKTFDETITRHHLMWFAPPHQMIPFLNYQISDC